MSTYLGDVKNELQAALPINFKLSYDFLSSKLLVPLKMHEKLLVTCCFLCFVWLSNLVFRTSCNYDSRFSSFSHSIEG